MKSWRDSFIDLLHCHTELLLMLEATKKEDSNGRRRYDCYFVSAKERVDNIVLNAPKE